MLKVTKNMSCEEFQKIVYVHTQKCPINQNGKALTYDERPKTKKDAQQKSSLFLRNGLVFLSGISLHYWPFVVLYSFSVYVEILLKTFSSNNLSFTHKNNDEYW